MNISKNKVVTLNYTLTDDEEGIGITSSDPNKPLHYLHGYGNIVSGLEHALEGEATGFTGSITLGPDDCYGKYLDNAVVVLPRQHFPQSIEPGMEFHIETSNGFTSMRVLAVSDTTVKLDSNHPLAGKTLHFVVEVLDVREGSEDEIKQGHVDWHG